MTQFKFLLTGITCSLLLAACNVSGSVLSDLSETGSGSVSTVKSNFSTALDGFLSIKNNIDLRLQKIQSGALMIKEGKEMLEEGVQ